MMKRAIVITLFFQISCVFFISRKEVIKDVGVKQSLVFISKSQNPSNYKLEIESNVDGEASIYSGNIELVRIPKGKYQQSLMDDQYDDTLRLEYVPKGVTKGEIIINYYF